MDLCFWNNHGSTYRKLIFEELEQRIVLDATVDQTPCDISSAGVHWDPHDPMLCAQDLSPAPQELAEPPVADSQMAVEVNSETGESSISSNTRPMGPAQASVMPPDPVSFIGSRAHGGETDEPGVEVAIDQASDPSNSKDLDAAPSESHDPAQSADSNDKVVSSEPGDVPAAPDVQHGIRINLAKPSASFQTDSCGRLIFSGASEITISGTDADSALDPIMVKLSSSGGDLTFTGEVAEAVIVDHSAEAGQSTMTFTGSVNGVNAAIKQVMFRSQPVPDASMPWGNASVLISADDQRHSQEQSNPSGSDTAVSATTDTMAISINEMPISRPWWNQSPVHYFGRNPIGPTNPEEALPVDASWGKLAFDGFPSIGPGHAQVLSVSDDAEEWGKIPMPRSSQDSNIQTIVSVAKGTLDINESVAKGVAIDENHTGTVTLTGTPSAVNAALKSLVYCVGSTLLPVDDSMLVITNDLGHNPPDYVGALTQVSTIQLCTKASSS